MQGYLPAASTVVVITSLLLLYILKRKKLLNVPFVIGTFTSSMVISLLFPAVMGAAADISGFSGTGSGFAFVAAAVVVLHVILALLCSIAVASAGEKQVFAGVYQTGRNIYISLWDRLKGREQEEQGPDGSESLDTCIDKACSLKQQNRYEDAIRYYICALDKKPDNDIVFWIVLDLCSLYKLLGKPDLAKLILDSYAEVYRDEMSENIRHELEKNLLYS